jgi:hypothetical protein
MFNLFKKSPPLKDSNFWFYQEAFKKFVGGVSDLNTEPIELFEYPHDWGNKYKYCKKVLRITGYEIAMDIRVLKTGQIEIRYNDYTKSYLKPHDKYYPAKLYTKKDKFINPISGKEFPCEIFDIVLNENRIRKEDSAF